MSTVLPLNNEDVEKLLTIKNVMGALDEAYLELDKGQTANRPRTFTFSPSIAAGLWRIPMKGLFATREFMTFAS